MALIFNRYVQAMDLKLPETEPELPFEDLQRVSQEGKTAIRDLTCAGIIKGKSNIRFDPSGSTKRSETAAIIHRFIEKTKE